MDISKVRNPSLLISYMSLRKNVGLLGGCFPFILFFGGYYVFSMDIRPSFSAYYHTPMRDVFVGMLCAIGVFLISYNGYDRRDKIVSTIAGVCAIGTAFFPVDQDETGPISMIGGTHLAFAFTYFVLLAYFCLAIFPKTAHNKPITAEKRRRNAIYRCCGYVMIVCIFFLASLSFMPRDLSLSLTEYYIVFWLESFATVAFGISWFVKGQGVLKDTERTPQVAPEPI